MTNILGNRTIILLLKLNLQLKLVQLENIQKESKSGFILTNGLI